MTEQKETQVLVVNKTNIYEKLQKCRVELQNKKMNKSGKNTFAGYEYFELGDFLPEINKLFDKYGMCGVVSYTEQIASLTIINTADVEQQIVFSSPMRDATLKGCHPVQNLGAVETYQRRYLYVMALEIVEHDALDGTVGKKEAIKTETKPITGYQIKQITTLLEKKQVDRKKFLSFYKIESVEQLDSDTAVKAMRMLQAKPDKEEDVILTEQDYKNIDAKIEEDRAKKAEAVPVRLASDEQKKKIFALLHGAGLDAEEGKEAIKLAYSLQSFNDITVSQASEQIEKLNGMIAEKDKKEGQV